MRTLLPLFLIALLAAGCYYDNEDDLYGPACDASVFSYSAKIQPIIQANCQNSSCHGAGQADGNGELLTYDNVMTFIQDNRLRNAVVVNKSMPKDGSLTTCERDLIEKWLNAGAPNN